MNQPRPTERQARILWAALTGLGVAALVGLAVGAIWGLGRVLQILAPVLWPLAVAGVLAYLLDPVVDWLERRKMARSRAIISVFVLALLIVAGLASAVVPQLVNEGRDLAVRIPSYVKRVESWVQDRMNNPPAIIKKYLRRESPTAPGPAAAHPPQAPAATNPEPPTAGITNGPPPAPQEGPAPGAGKALDQQTLQSAATSLAQALPRIGLWLSGQISRVASWFGMLAGVVLIPVYLFYLLLEKSRIKSNWTHYLPVKQSGLKDELVFVISAINDHLIAFFRGQVLVAICDGLLYTIGFFAIGLPYALLLGAMATCLTLIPFLGAITTCATALILALVQFGDWQHPALVLVVFAIVQSIEGLLISPKIMGDRVGLHPLAIIIAVMTGTTLLGGLLGGVLAIPLTAAGKVIMFRYVWKKR